MIEFIFNEKDSEPIGYNIHSAGPWMSINIEQFSWQAKDYDVHQKDPED